MRDLLQRPMLLCLAVAMMLIWSVGVPAQTPPKPDGSGNKESAVYEGMQGDIVVVKLGAMSWRMKLDPKVEVTFTGSAETDFVQLVQAPLMVRFRADVTRQKKVTEPVKEIEIVNVSDNDKPGAVNEDQGPGGLTGGPKGGPPPEKSTYLISGHVTSYKNGEMTVMGIKVPVDPMAKVTVNLTGLAALLATPAQSNTVISYKYYTKQPGLGIITKMESTSVVPLAAPKKPMPRTPANTKGKLEPKPDEPKVDDAKAAEKKE